MKKNDELVAMLDNYMENDVLSGAFFIDGSWGSGKTYFIKKYIEHYNDTFDDEAVYVSLNGLETIDSVNTELFGALHPAINKIKDSVFAKVLTVGAKVTASFLGGDISSIGEVDDDIVEKLRKCSTRMIVFDDLERCKVDITELFGYFNSIIEKCGKIIIIGDEIELKKYLNTKELSTNKIISSILISKEKEEKEISKEKLKKQIELIAEPIYYEAIKEKTVSLTYSFIFDESILFDDIIDDKRYESIKKTIQINKEYVLWILSKYNCKNFRTCILAIEFYYKIYDVVQRIELENKDEIERDTLLATFQYMVIEKHPLKECDLGFFLERNSINMGDYYSIKNNVKTLLLNVQELQKELLNEDAKYSKMKKGLIPQSLSDLKETWIYKSDEILTKNIDQLIDDFNNGKIPLESLHLVYLYLHSYTNAYGFDYNLSADEVKNQIIQKIKDSDRFIEAEDEGLLLLNLPENQKQGVKDIYLAITVHNQSIQKKNIEDKVLSSKRLTIEEISNISNQSITRNAFLSIFKTSDLIDYIKHSDNESVDGLRYIVRNVYHFGNIKDFYFSDIDAVKYLKDELEKYKPESHTKSKIIEWFIELLDDIYRRLL